MTALTTDQRRKTYSIEEAAAALGVGRSTAYDAIKRGEFPVPVIRVGARLVVSRAALDALLDPDGKEGAIAAAADD